MTRAAIYLRLSKETESSTSIARQRKECLAFAAARGWEVVAVEEDVDVSASHRRLDRPGLDRIRARFAEIDVLLFWKSDRLARSILDFSTLLEEAEAADVGLVSATEPLDFTSPLGRAMAQIVAIFAEMEAKTIGLRVSSTIEHLRRTGKEPGGRVPYGYRRVPSADGRGTVYEIDPAEGAIVREAIERALKGEGILTIAKDFTRRGVPTRTGQGRAWRPSTLQTILRSPHLLGWTVHRGEVVRDADGLPLAPRPAFLSREEFDVLQATLAKRTRAGGRPKGSALTLSGLAVCERCGSRLSTHRGRSKKGSPVENYRCSGPHCPGLSIEARRLDDLIEREFLERFGDHAEIRFTPAPLGHRDEAAEIRSALDSLETDRYERGLFRGDDGAARFAELHARLSARLAEVAEDRPESRGWAVTGRTLREAWESASPAARREMLDSALECPIIVRRGKRGGFTPPEERVRISWKGAE